jgi:hypothetical protein
METTMRKLLTFLIVSTLLLPASVYAQGMMMMGAGSTRGGGGGGGGGFALTYGSSAGNNSPSGTINYGTLSYPSGATRIVVGVQWFPTGGTDTITGITVGGTALTQISGAYGNIGGSQPVAADVWISSAPLSGSSGAVSVTYSAAPAHQSSVALYGLTTTTPAPSADAVTIGGYTTSISTSLTIPSGGGALVLTNASNGITVSSFTNAAQDVDVAAGWSGFYYAHTTATVAGTTITATYASNDIAVLSVVAWGP